MTEDKKLYPNFSPKNKKNTLFFKLDRLSKRFKINKMALNKISNSKLYDRIIRFEIVDTV